MNKVLSSVVAGWIFLMSGIATATEPPKMAWSQGAVVLANQQVLTGEIVAEPAHDLMLFRNEKGLMVYPAHAVKSFLFHDQASNINRKYISQVSTDRGLKVYHLYEIVLWGEIAILRKQKIQHTNTPAPSDAFDFDYFVSYKNEIIRLQQFRKKVYPQMLALHRSELNFFMKKEKEKLNPNLPADAIRIVEFYNSLVRAGSHRG